MAELLDDFLRRELKTRPHLVGRGILPAGGKAILGGVPKSNKSWIALNIGLDIALGRDLFGARYANGTPVFPVPEAARVLYLEQEIGEHTLQRRLQTLMIGKVPDGNLEEVEFFVKTKDMKMRMDNEEGIAAILAEVESVMPRLLILDPLAKFHLMGENSAQEMGAVLRFGDVLCERFGTALLYVHHTSKPNEEYPRRGGDRLRGSSAIFADVDTCIIVGRKGADSVKEPILDLDFELRCGEPLENIRVKRLVDGSIIYAPDEAPQGGPMIRHRRGGQKFAVDQLTEV